MQLPPPKREREGEEANESEVSWKLRQEVTSPSNGETDGILSSVRIIQPAGQRSRPPHYSWMGA